MLEVLIFIISTIISGFIYTLIYELLNEWVFFRKHGRFPDADEEFGYKFLISLIIVSLCVGSLITICVIRNS